MPACIVHQSRSIDTGNTMHDNPLQTMTIDSVTYIKSGILQKGTRSGRGTERSEVPRPGGDAHAHMLQTCRCCMCKCCNSEHMRGTWI